MVREFCSGYSNRRSMEREFSNDSQSVLTLVWETLYTWVTLSKSSTSSSDQTKDSVFPSAFPLPLDLNVFLLEFAMVKSTWKFQSRGSEQHDVKLNKDGAETWLSRAQMFNNAHALWVKSSVFKSYTCRRSNTIRKRYVWTQIFLNTEKGISVFENTRQRVDGV